MKLTRGPRSRRRASVSDGMGPENTSPPLTITASSGTSASTASSAGRFPWTSYSAATLIRTRPCDSEHTDPTAGLARPPRRSRRGLQIGIASDASARSLRQHEAEEDDADDSVHGEEGR